MITVPANRLSLVGVLRSPETAERLEAYCNAASDISADIRRTEGAIDAAPSIINGGADIVIVESGEAGPSDLAALEKLCAYVARGGSFIVIMEAPSADVVRRLFRAGVTDVLPTPVMESELIAALDTARGRAAERRPAPSPPGGKIVSVVKSSGGVGATTIAANIAAAFHPLVADVGLVDLDVQFGQLATALDFEPRMNLLDAIRAGSRLDRTLLASTMHRHASGVDVLAAPATLTPLDAVSEAFVERLFECLRANHAVSIVELPAAWTQAIGVALDRSDAIVVVIEPSVRSAAGAARIAQGLVDFGLTKPNVYLLANKFDKSIESSARIKKIGDIFHVKPGGAVRLDVKTGVEAADRGLLFSDAAPKSPAIADFEANARRIAASIGMSVAETHPPAARLGRLFGARADRKGLSA